MASTVFNAEVGDREITDGGKLGLGSPGRVMGGVTIPVKTVWFGHFLGVFAWESKGADVRGKTRYMLANRVDKARYRTFLSELTCLTSEPNLLLASPVSNLRLPCHFLS
jgi:hypothetical protein